MPTLTNAQKAQIAIQEKTDKSARRWAIGTMTGMLALSTAANVLTAWDHDMVSKVVAGVPPLSLFATSMLYERMRATTIIKFGMLLTILVSLAFSWVHIAELAYTHHQNLYISVLLPIIIDVPMLFAGTILINQAKPVATTPKTVKAVATTTVKVKAPTKTRTVRNLNPSPVTA